MVPRTVTDFDAEDLDEARGKFLFWYGFAMSEWAGVERSLYYWFGGITKIKQGLARGLFYGARGFVARLEMIESAIPYAEQQSAEELAFIKDAIKKARQFSSFRNKLAHGEPMPVLINKKVNFILRSGKTPTDEATKHTVEHIEIAADNFHNLAAYMLFSIPHFQDEDTLTLSEYHQRVLQLPNEAHLRSDPIGKGSAQQPPDGRVNKKQFRAERAKSKKQD